MMRRRAAIVLLSSCALVAACGAERRTTGPGQPQTAPNGPSDPRIAPIEANFSRLSDGGRYFTWYGCSPCHAQGAAGVRKLDDTSWRHGGGFDQVYQAIAAHPGVSPSYSARIPSEQLWDITAYVRSLPSLEADRRRRQDFDQQGEAQGNTWSGPVQ